MYMSVLEQIFYLFSVFVSSWRGVREHDLVSFWLKQNKTKQNMITHNVLQMLIQYM